MPTGLPIEGMKPDLAQAILAFDHFGADQIHPDRAGAYLPSTLSKRARDRLTNSTRLKGRLDRLACREVELAPLEWNDFRNPDACLAVLEGAELEQVGNLVGATLEGFACRRMIFKEERQSVEDLLPANGYEFVIRHLDLARTSENAAPLDVLLERIRNLGREALAGYMTEVSPAIAERLILKFPGRFDQDMKVGSSLEGGVIKRIMAIIAEEIYRYGTD